MLPADRRFVVQCWLVLLAAFLLLDVARAAEPRRVLVLYSLGADSSSAWQSLLRKGLDEELAKANPGSSLSIFEERFDAIRLGQDNSIAAMESYLNTKYAAIRFDSIITENYVAARFLSEHPRLFPGVPRIYLNHRRRDWQPVDGVSYEVRADFAHAVGVIPRVAPQIKRIVVIGDRSEPIMQEQEAELRSVAASYQGQLEFEFWDELDFATLFRQAAALPPDSALFLIGAFRDINGTLRRPTDIARKLADSTRAPIFTNLESIVIPGVAGGYVVSAERIGHAIGRLLLNQAPDIAGIPGYVFDYPTVKRLHLQNMPDNVRWLNRPPSIWSQYWWQIVAGLTLIVLEGILISALVVAARERRQSLLALDKERCQLEARVQQRTQELSEANSKLEQLATSDPLTGIGNRRRMTMQITRELERSRRHHHPLTLLMVDIDHFKQVNDSHGHDAGDRAIVAVARTLALGVRSIDMASRFGGEEFVLLLPETDTALAVSAAERLRAEVEALQVADDQSQTIRLTISIGVASADPDGVVDTVSTLLIRADRALYRAKNEGRNRVVSASGAEAGPLA